MHLSLPRWLAWPGLIRPGWMIAMLALALSASKLMWVESTSRTLLGCAWCASGRALPHELQWLLALAALHLIAATRLAARWRLGGLLRLALIGLLLLAAADLFVLQQFLVRLTLGEAMKFAGEPQAWRGFLGQLGPGLALLAGALLLLGALLAARYVAGRRVSAQDDASQVRPAGRRTWWLVAAALACATLAAAAKLDDQHTPYLQNSLEAFLTVQSRQRAYSSGFVADLPHQSDDASRCLPGAASRPDVILLMVESLSAYHSRYFNGIHDWTPELDRISAAATSLQNFYANGVNSEQGLIALLTGEPPIERPGARGRTLFEGFMTPKDSVPRMLRRAGYETRFISGFNLDFPGLQPWLAAIGFDRVEGQEAAFFAGRSSVRLHFDSVLDELLFERVLHELAQPRDKPLFVTSFTQSTHHPYYDPSTGQRTQEAAFRYADRALGRFVDGLRAQRYFDKGYLLIVGDHRAMQPMDSRERERFGDRGFARVPMTVVGPGDRTTGPTRLAEAFSQTDLLPSLRQLVSADPVCAAPDQGLFLGAQRVVPQCLYTLRAYNPNRVYAQCGQSDAVIELDGDDTRQLGSPVANQPVLQRVNRFRLGHGFE